MKPLGPRAATKDYDETPFDPTWVILDKYWFDFAVFPSSLSKPPKTTGIVAERVTYINSERQGL